jgi:predicted amidohydrolase
MSRSLTVGLVQMEPKLGDLEANLGRVIRFTKDTARQGANLVVFPELILTGYHQELLGDKLFELALSLEDEPIRRLANAAKDANAYVVAGFIEKGRIPGVVYNSIVFCGPDGSVLGSYAKSHLFAGEKLYFRQGASIHPLKTSYGVLGPMICMDIGFPEVGRILCLQGAELLVAPSAWITEDEDIWQTLLQSRALDNIAFMAGMNRVGDEGKLHFVGRSMMIDPRGHILAELKDEEDVLLTTIDLDEVMNARRRAPRFTGRRPELYGPIADLEAN